jgi:hypothetical protein
MLLFAFGYILASSMLKPLMEIHTMSQERRKRDAGILQVTERDLLVLTWIAEQYCISYDHVQLLLAYYTPAVTKHPDKVAPSTAQNAIERWLQLGYIDVPRKVVREHATYLWLSRKGLKELDLPYAYYQPKPSTIHHIYATNTIRLHMQRFNLSAEWRAQRTIRLHTIERPLPDAEFVMNESPLVAIQVLEQQRLLTISVHDELATMRALAARYARLWYFAHAQALSMLQAALQEHDRAVPVDEQLAPHIVWYGLNMKELPTEKQK